MNETDKGKLQRIITQIRRDGYDNLCNADIDWLVSYASQLEIENDGLKEQLDFVNEELPLLTARLAAQTDQVFRGV